MKCFIVTLLTLLTFQIAEAQLNVALLHQLVGHSKDEHDRQLKARNNQLLVNGQEEINRSKMEQLKGRYRQLKDRYNILGTIISGIGLGMQSAPIISEIYGQQERILSIASSDPAYIPLAMASEREMLNAAIQLGRYTTMLLVSVGDLNQMRVSDRRLLLGHIILELRKIAGTSRGLANTLYASSLSTKQDINPFSGYTNQDLTIVNKILDRLEQYR